jgi:hypothetical protein
VAARKLARDMALFIVFLPFLALGAVLVLGIAIIKAIGSLVSAARGTRAARKGARG